MSLLPRLPASKKLPEEQIVWVTVPLPDSVQGLQYYFLEEFSRKLSFYECENFSDSFRHHIFESENPRFPFFLTKKQHYLGSEEWKIKLQKIEGNLLHKFRKLYMYGTVNREV